MKTNFGEFKIQTLREIAPDFQADTPARINEYIQQHVKNASWFDSEKEVAIVILLNTRRRIIGFNLVSIGTLDSTLTHPRELFKPAIVASASAIVFAHNHPSGDTTPSEADIRITREFIKAGQLLKIDLLDHVVWSTCGKFTSLRELGHFYL